MAIFPSLSFSLAVCLPACMRTHVCVCVCVCACDFVPSIGWDYSFNCKTTLLQCKYHFPLWHGNHTSEDRKLFTWGWLQQLMIIKWHYYIECCVTDWTASHHFTMKLAFKLNSHDRYAQIMTRMLFMWWLLPRRWGFWEGWWSVLACSLVAVESNSCWADPTTLWTGKGLGWGWLGCCMFSLPPASFLCGFMPLCLKLMNGFSQWWAPAVSVWGLLLPWLTADSHLCNLSLQLVFVTLSWRATITLSFLELA